MRQDGAVLVAATVADGAVGMAWRTLDVNPVECRDDMTCPVVSTTAASW